MGGNVLKELAGMPLLIDRWNHFVVFAISLRRDTNL